MWNGQEVKGGEGYLKKGGGDMKSIKSSGFGHASTQSSGNFPCLSDRARKTELEIPEKFSFSLSKKYQPSS